MTKEQQAEFTRICCEHNIGTTAQIELTSLIFCISIDEFVRGQNEMANYPATDAECKYWVDEEGELRCRSSNGNT